jgi:hypothetical protein
MGLPMTAKICTGMETAIKRDKGADCLHAFEVAPVVALEQYILHAKIPCMDNDSFNKQP